MVAPVVIPPVQRIDRVGTHRSGRLVFAHACARRGVANEHLCLHTHGFVCGPSVGDGEGRFYLYHLSGGQRRGRLVAYKPLAARLFGKRHRTSGRAVHFAPARGLHLEDVVKRQSFGQLDRHVDNAEPARVLHDALPIEMALVARDVDVVADLVGQRGGRGIVGHTIVV